MRASLCLLQKTTTGLTGLLVHPRPLPALIATYGRTLTALKHLPEAFTYRQGTEALTRSRLTAVERVLGGSAWESASESQQDAWVKEVERELGNDGAVQVEEMIDMARGEEQLVAKMIEWKAWEPLQVPPPPGQWSNFKLDD